MYQITIQLILPIIVITLPIIVMRNNNNNNNSNRCGTGLTYLLDEVIVQNNGGYVGQRVESLPDTLYVVRDQVYHFNPYR